MAVVEIAVRTTGDLPETGNLVVFAAPDGGLGEAARTVEERAPVIARAVRAAGSKARHGTVIAIPAPAGLDLDHLLVVLAERRQDRPTRSLEELGGRLIQKLEQLGLQEAVVASPAGLDLGLSAEEAMAAFALGAALRSYSFDKYRSESSEENRPQTVRRLSLIGDRRLEERVRMGHRLASAVAWCRDLVSEPANVLYPGSFAERCLELRDTGLEVEVLPPERLEELGMRALLAVGRGSANPPYMVILRWRGAEQEAPLALVGKGVCFDSGGISIKPAAGMQDMKWDMAGAAAVTGAMQALALRKAPVDVVGVVGLAENMPSGTAQRPGDVIRSYSGTTIEVINTDAEGRLLLADAIAYTCDRFRPRALVDLATLTGAVIVALGHERAGLFGNRDELAESALRAGEEVGEELWRLPLGKPYEEHIRSDIADIKNVGRGREAGSIAGAVFLQRFVSDRPWLHLDIAGVAWANRDLPLARKGATGFGVRLLDRLTADRFEEG